MCESCRRDWFKILQNKTETFLVSVTHFILRFSILQDKFQKNKQNWNKAYQWQSHQVWGFITFLVDLAHCAACQIVYAAISFAFYFALTFSIHKLELFDTFSKPLFYAKPRRINFSFFTAAYTIKRWSFDFSHKILSRFRAVSFFTSFLRT